jgi:dihydrofolate reductase
MISIVAAVAKNGVIGKSGELPWYLPEDLKHFKKLTSDHTVVMGRKTYESIMNRLGKPLPNRKNIVITRTKNMHVHPGAFVYNDLDSAFKEYREDEEIMVIGGGEIYKQAFDQANKLYITEVHKEVEGDVTFPEIDKNIWKETFREDHDGFSFVEYERI